ncbi:hypothetical protein AYK20_01305 [Thermoplasmatales archaeon SG8-52-1]|nr:MAG: hypothetical protein AYK20_01305 [Thermoplasmatales archaeon SG8-52-1]
MKEEDKKAFLEDFKKADISKKLDMWYFALDQQMIWEEIIAEMSDIAQIQSINKGQMIEE